MLIFTCTWQVKSKVIIAAVPPCKALCKISLKSFRLWKKKYLMIYIQSTVHTSDVFLHLKTSKYVSSNPEIFLCSILCSTTDSCGDDVFSDD